VGRPESGFSDGMNGDNGDAFHGDGQGDKGYRSRCDADDRIADRNGKIQRRDGEAGVLLAGEGLHPSSKGARIRYSGNGSAVTKGPFPATGDLVAGFWLIQVGSKDEAISWMKRAPFGDGSEVELRQVLSAEDFGEALTPELREQEERLRARSEGKS
jgi:hypothetical protein